MSAACTGSIRQGVILRLVSALQVVLAFLIYGFSLGISLAIPGKSGKVCCKHLAAQHCPANRFWNWATAVGHLRGKIAATNQAPRSEVHVRRSSLSQVILLYVRIFALLIFQQS